ncbi:MAG: ribbon-helix-helix protein, CopG family [Desulfurococcales archaeon]|nr:ribbon-helix-helix protein, CopG family [Desulfurococcales archaeon]
MRVISFKAEEELAELLYAYAASRGMHVSEVIRRAIRYYILHNPEPKARVFKTDRIKIY